MAEAVISMQVDIVKLDEGRVVLNSSLRNVNDESLVFLPWGTPFAPIVSAPFLQVQRRLPDSRLANVLYEGRVEFVAGNTFSECG